MSNVVYLHGQPQSIAQFVRVGSSNHRRLEQLLSSGTLPPQRLVLDAGTFLKQADLAKALRQGGREITLDTNVAELSCIGKFQGAAQGAPWADAGRPLTPLHFTAGANEYDIVGKIARFCVQHGIRRVHAPAHFLAEGAKDKWLGVDLETCSALRRALDIEGGNKIVIDYPLMISNATLNDGAERKVLVAALTSLPIEGLWLRISGFGASATAVGLRKYISAAQDFVALQRPIVSDGVGGIAARAIAAFGAACGISHGVAEKERFDTSDWNKPPRPGRGGGGYVLLFAGIDRLLLRSEAEVLMAASGARRLASCNDRTCCPHGLEDTLRDPKGHYLRQRASQIGALSDVPEPRRVKHFLDTDLANADRTARQLSKLKIADSVLLEMLSRNSERLDRMRTVLEDLQKTMTVTPPPPGIPRADNLASENHDRHA